uniref:Uncharacterized protein n=1 Tax=Panagrolaimus davidi TaxID=227884 RepID=A0A914PCZ3_9BILA
MKVKYNELAIKYEYFIPEDIFVPGEPQGISADEIWDEYSPETFQSPTHYFNHQNKINQNFPFQRPFLNYIVENANGKVLEKLFKTCKLFYWFFPVQICYQLEVGRGWPANRIRFRDNSAHLTCILSQNDFPNIIIANSFRFLGYRSDNLSNLIIPRLYKCEAKHIDISEQNFTSNELEMLVGNGNVMSLELVRVKITDCKTGNTLDAADILKLTPKVEIIWYVHISKPFLSIRF